MTLLLLSLAAAVCGAAPDVRGAAPEDGPGRAAVERRGDGRAFTVDGSTAMTWSPGGATVKRPHFTDLRAPGGDALSRSHPPTPGVDPTDHADMHPGLWLAFGDISGKDFWRNKGPSVASAVAPAAPGSRAASFSVVNEYRDGGDVVCTETCRYTLLPRPAGRLLIVDSTFRARDADFSFGDQEEMGLGVRVATPLAVTRGGRILDGDGRVNEKQVWGRESEWCDYGGRVGGRDVGVMIIPDPKNFRRSRFHARDYGLLVANPFGSKAFGAAQASRVTVRRGESLRLRFGVLLRRSPNDGPSLAAAFEDCRRQMDAEREAYPP